MAREWLDHYGHGETHEERMAALGHPSAPALRSTIRALLTEETCLRPQDRHDIGDGVTGYTRTIQLPDSPDTECVVSVGMSQDAGMVVRTTERSANGRIRIDDVYLISPGGIIAHLRMLTDGADPVAVEGSILTRNVPTTDATLALQAFQEDTSMPVPDQPF